MHVEWLISQRSQKMRSCCICAKANMPFYLSSPREWVIQSVSNPPVFWASGISWRLHQLYYYCYFCKKLNVPLKGLRTALSYRGGKGDTWDKGCGWEHLGGGLIQLVPFQQALCHLFFNSVGGRYVCALSPWYGQEPLLARTYPLGIF